MEYVETLVMRMVVLVLDCIVQYECRKIVNWKEVWCEGETVWYGELGVGRDGSYIPGVYPFGARILHLNFSTPCI